MDTLQQAPALWYWSEPASGYSIEDCEQIVAMHHCHESDHTPVEKPLPDQKNNPYTAKRAVLF